MILPDYSGGGIVNLMSSIATALDVSPTGYPQATLLAEQQMTSATNIVLMIIDGLGYDYLCARGEGSYLHDHLRGRLTSVCPSTTASAIPTFLTGVAPLQHGFTGWFTYFKELADVLAVLPFRPRHGGDSLAPQGYTPLQLSGAKPLLNQLTIESSVIMPDWIADSDFNRAYNGRAKSRPYSDMKGFFKAIKASISRRARQYIYAYWPHYDSISHVNGVASDQVFNHFQELDDGIRQLARMLSGSNTVLMITADHGFIDTQEDRAIYLHNHPELQRMLTLPICGEPRLSYCYINPSMEESFKAYISSELGDCVDLYPSRQLLEDGWFGTGVQYPPILDRIGHYALVPKENYKIKDWILGERQYVHIGVHGGISSEEMYVPLVYAEL